MRHLLLALLTMLCLAQAAQAQQKLTFARIENIPDQQIGGDILVAAYKRLDIEVELHDVPAKRALALSSAGDLDGEVHRIGHLSDAYPTLLRVTPAINYIEPSAFTLGRQIDLQGWPSLRDYSIGIVRGVGSSEDGTRGIADVQAVTDLRQLFEMLNAGRFEVAICDLFSGLLAVKQLRLQRRIQALSPPLQRIDIYHHLHEKHRALVPRIAAVLQDMADSGELATLRTQLIQQYLAEMN